MTRANARLVTEDSAPSKFTGLLCADFSDTSADVTLTGPLCVARLSPCGGASNESHLAKRQFYQCQTHRELVADLLQTEQTRGARTLWAGIRGMQPWCFQQVCKGRGFIPRASNTERVVCVIQQLREQRGIASLVILCTRPQSLTDTGTHEGQSLRRRNTWEYPGCLLAHAPSPTSNTCTQNTAARQVATQ
jgi:hypothetical protein